MFLVYNRAGGTFFKSSRDKSLLWAKSATPLFRIGLKSTKSTLELEKNLIVETDMAW